MLFRSGSQVPLANPFDNIKHTTVGEDTTHTADNGTSHGESQSTGWNKFNETPQGGIEGLDTDKYLTSATKTTSEASTDGTAQSTQDGKRNTEYTYTGRSSGDAYYSEMTKMYKITKVLTTWYCTNWKTYSSVCGNKERW